MIEENINIRKIVLYSVLGVIWILKCTRRIKFKIISHFDIFLKEDFLLKFSRFYIHRNIFVTRCVKTFSIIFVAISSTKVYEMFFPKDDKGIAEGVRIEFIE